MTKNKKTIDLINWQAIGTSMKKTKDGRFTNGIRLMDNWQNDRYQKHLYSDGEEASDCPA